MACNSLPQSSCLVIFCPIMCVYLHHRINAKATRRLHAQCAACCFANAAHDCRPGVRLLRRHGVPHAEVSIVHALLDILVAVQNVVRHTAAHFPVLCIQFRQRPLAALFKKGDYLFIFHGVSLHLYTTVLHSFVTPDMKKAPERALISFFYLILLRCKPRSCRYTQGRGS